MAKPTKRIRIPYSGPINAKSGVYGPITTPYREELDVIQAILVAGVPVIEVIDGREITLSLSNYKNDFTKNKDDESVPLEKGFNVPVPSDFNKPPADLELIGAPIAPNSDGASQIAINAFVTPATTAPVVNEPQNKGNNSNKNHGGKNKERNSQKQTNVTPDNGIEK